MEVQEKFFKMVDDAVALNIENQLLFEGQKNYTAPAHFLEGFGTVNINVGRGTGKTKYIQARMRPCDMIIVPMEYDVLDYNRADGGMLKLESVVSARQLFDRFNMSGYWRGRHDLPQYWNKVYVDEPGRVFATKDSIYQFYDWFGKRCNQVIMLGTAIKR